MGGLELLAQAQALGFEVTDLGGLLKVRGPLEHEGLVQQLLAAKVEVLAVLREESDATTFPAPGAPCLHCGCRAFWRRVPGHWLCVTCHPAPRSEAVAEERQMTERLPVASGPVAMSDDVAEPLKRFAWERVARIEFPAAVTPVLRAKEANEAKEVVAAKREASDVG